MRIFFDRDDQSRQAQEARAFGGLLDAECDRLAGLPLADQIAGLKEFLGQHGRLERAEALINTLLAQRARWEKGTPK